MSGRLIDLPLVENEEEIHWNGLQVLAVPRKPEGDHSPDLQGFLINNWVARDLSDESGRFELTGLTAGPYEIFFAAHDYEPYDEESRIGARSPAMELTIPGPGEFDIGDTLVSRPRRCTLSGVIHPSTDDPLPDPRYLEVRVQYPRGHEGDKPVRKEVRVDSDWSFESWVFCSPDFTPAILEVREIGQEEWTVSQRVEVIPYRDLIVQVLYP